MNPQTRNIFARIGLFVIVWLIVGGFIGGFLYLYFPREDQIGDASIIKSCRELGGDPGWIKWPQGCGLGECYVEMCTGMSLK